MDLSRVSTLDLERLRAALAGHRLSFPLSRLGLQGEGLELLATEVPALNAMLEDARLAAVLEAQFVAGEWFTRVS